MESWKISLKIVQSDREVGPGKGVHILLSFAQKVMQTILVLSFLNLFLPDVFHFYANRRICFVLEKFQLLRKLKK